MRWYKRIALVVVVCFVSVSAIIAQESPAKPKPKIELRWIEGGHIEGLTDRKTRYPGSEAKGDFVYPHIMPALVLTPAEVEEVNITTLKPGSRVQYGLSIKLTDKARKALAMSFEGTETRWITVMVDGYCWGYQRYEPSNEKSGWSSGVWAKNYNPSLGYTVSKAYVERVADALKK